jgi:hypothetical protein
MHLATGPWGHWSRMRSLAHEIRSPDFGAGMVVSGLPGGVWPAQKNPAGGTACGALGIVGWPLAIGQRSD